MRVSPWSDSTDDSRAVGSSGGSTGPSWAAYALATQRCCRLLLRRCGMHAAAGPRQLQGARSDAAKAKAAPTNDA